MLATVDAAQSERWDTIAELLATLIEVVDFGNRMYFQANTAEGTECPDPIVIPRPGTDTASPPEPRQATASEMREFFGGAVTYTP